MVSNATRSIQQNIQLLNERIATNLGKASKSQGFAYLLAASKTKPVEAVQEAYDSGQRIFGENYVDDLLSKYQKLPEDIRWHFIGHLQTNKVKKLLEVPNLVVVETVDSQKLADKLQKECKKKNRELGVFIQVLSSEEGTKSGISIEEAPKLANYICHECPELKLKGLMSMGKLNDVEGFRKMHELKLNILKEYADFVNEADFVLSIGTSKDWELAMEEGGANEIRIGTDIFGAREYPKKAQ